MPSSGSRNIAGLLAVSVIYSLLANFIVFALSTHRLYQIRSRSELVESLIGEDIFFILVV